MDDSSGADEGRQGASGSAVNGGAGAMLALLGKASGFSEPELLSGAALCTKEKQARLFEAAQFLTLRYLYRANDMYEIMTYINSAARRRKH